MPNATGNGNDVLRALLPDTAKFPVLRMPYPMGLYAKGMGGRIDDPKTGWKGALGHVRHANTISLRRRKRDDEQGLAFSASA